MNIQCSCYVLIFLSIFFADKISEPLKRGGERRRSGPQKHKQTHFPRIQTQRHTAHNQNDVNLTATYCIDAGDNVRGVHN